MGQVVYLTEIVAMAGKHMYVCYIDFQKAYDRVLEEALFAKLEVIAAALQFIKALYNKSQVQVRVGGGMTPPILIMRGVTQVLVSV